jgi:hypothetical protein
VGVNMQTNNNAFKELIKKIHSDAGFYLNKFLKIRTKDGQLKPFVMNPAQQKCLDIINQMHIENKPVRIIWLKARQLGISTLCEGLIFHDTANNPFKSSLIIAHEDKATQNLFNMSKLFYEELPALVRPMKKYSNESALSFENPTNNDEEKYQNPGLRSKITVATAKNVQTARSNTVHNLHASEVAFWDDAETLMTGLLQCVPDTPNSMILIESTANGYGGWFYDFWKRSERGETDYIPIFLAWFDNPEYTREFLSDSDKNEFIRFVERDKDSKHLLDVFKLTYEQLHWRKWCINNKCNGDLDQFHQEYPSTPEEAFIVSGRPVFNVDALRHYQEQLEEPIRTGYVYEKNNHTFFIDDSKGYVKIWREPEKDKFYAVGGDVAEGLSTGDYSCGIVLDEDYNLCAAWHGHIDPDLFGDEITKLAMYYNDAYLGVESNNHGHTTLRRIIKREYWNIYYQKSYNKLNDEVTQKPGWATNKRTKPIMIDTLAEFIREKWLDIKWNTLISELFTYARDDGGGTNAQTGCHDDALVALAIALQLLVENRGDNYAPEQSSDKKSKRIDYNDTDYYGEEFGVSKNAIQEYTI